MLLLPLLNHGSLYVLATIRVHLLTVASQRRQDFCTVSYVYPLAHPSRAAIHSLNMFRPYDTLMPAPFATLCYHQYHETPSCTSHRCAPSFLPMYPFLGPVLCSLTTTRYCLPEPSGGALKAPVWGVWGGCSTAPGTWTSEKSSCATALMVKASILRCWSERTPSPPSLP